MKIALSDAGKRFNRDWIFRHFNYQFKKGSSYAITGPNGSGKSTLLQVLSGSMLMNEGILKYESGQGAEIRHEDVYRDVSICAPYLEVVEEMTMLEFMEFHQGFKPLLPGTTINAIIEEVGLSTAINKQIRNYSSGMKQRVKLAQCIFSDTLLVLLDEPCTNLDAAGISLYRSLIERYCSDRLVIVSSNDPVEYQFCKEVISITDYK